MSRAASRALERRARDVIVRCPSSIGRPLSSSSTREHVLPGGVETMSILRSSTSSGEIFLVGTAHVSQRSAREVRELVRLVKPTTVCVELCEERLRTMREKIERETRDADGEGTSTGTSDFVRDAVKDFMGAFGGLSLIHI